MQSRRKASQAGACGKWPTQVTIARPGAQNAAARPRLQTRPRHVESGQPGQGEGTATPGARAQEERRERKTSRARAKKEGKARPRKARVRVSSIGTREPLEGRDPARRFLHAPPARGVNPPPQRAALVPRAASLRSLSKCPRTQANSLRGPAFGRRAQRHGSHDRSRTLKYLRSRHRARAPPARGRPAGGPRAVTRVDCEAGGLRAGGLRGGWIR